MYLARCLSLLALAGPALGQTALSGSVFDGSGGPLLAGQVYFATSTISVPAGQTLTVQPGAILKLGPGSLLAVTGVLDSLGGGATSHITSYSDDSLGGDTNGNGPSSGSPADWLGIRVLAGGTLDLDNTRIAYGGGGGYSTIHLAGGGIRVRDCVITESGAAGIDANAFDVEFTVEDTAIENCARWPMEEVLLVRVPELSGNTASGNGSGDAIQLYLSGPSRDTTIVTDNLLGGVLVSEANVRPIPVGVTLEFGPGVVVKNATFLNLWDVSGTLRLSGTEAEPVVFTSLDDDEYGGDTVGDGPTVGQPGDWAGIRFLGAGLVDAQHALVRYPGAGGYAGFFAQVGTLQLERCAVERSSGAGVDFVGNLTPCTITACRFDDNAKVPIDRIPIDILAGLDSNTASGNQVGDYIVSSTVNLAASATVAPRNLIGGSLVFLNSLNVFEGAELVLEAGTSFKFSASHNQLTSFGKLTARGTVARPVFFSSLADDTLGGDTNGDGPSFGAPGDWTGLRSSTTLTGGILDLEHVLVRNGGSAVYDNIYLAPGNHSLRSVRSERSSTSGFYCGGDQGTFFKFFNCVAYDNDFAGFEINTSIVQLDHATATGNHTGVFSTSAEGAVRNSVIWGNAIDYQQTPGSTVAFTHTTGVGIPAGTGNSSLDPLFVDAPNGDLRLAAGSPAVDAADTAVALAIGRDALDAPRLLAPVIPGGLKADMGAFEQARWSLSLTGTQALGESVTLRVDGAPGVSFLLYSPLLTNIPLAPSGVVLIGPTSLFNLATVSVGANLVLPLPADPTLTGVQIGIQGLTFLTADPNQSQWTDLERLRIEKALP